MQLIIHRGTREIGGSCVELTTPNSRILVDFGMPLVSRELGPFDSKSLKGKTVVSLKAEGILPDISGLYRGEKRDIDAILISHSHLDHYGFLQYVHPDIPVYLSKGADLLIGLSDIFLPAKVGKLYTQVVTPKKTFKIGDFTITPFLVDHSAFDALAFLIEAGGRRVFYSGDFRAHGRKSQLFQHMVKYPPERIDCLLMEGSALGREDARYRTEAEVEKRLAEILRERQNITFLFASSQNIDRLVSAYRACLRTDSMFVIDLYTAYILDRLKQISEHIPQYNWRAVRVKFLKSHADALAQAGHKDLLYAYNKSKIDMLEISKKKQRVLMLARDNKIFPALLKKIGNCAGGTIAFSMWDGYIKPDFRSFCRENGLRFEYIHTSGHAKPADLKAFASALAPKTLVPIHTFHPARYAKLFKNVKQLPDGEVLDLDAKPRIN